jgi:hypothetical protein
MPSCTFFRHLCMCVYSSRLVGAMCVCMLQGALHCRPGCLCNHHACQAVHGIAGCLPCKQLHVRCWRNVASSSPKWQVAGCCGSAARASRGTPLHCVPQRVRWGARHATHLSISLCSFLAAPMAAAAAEPAYACTGGPYPREQQQQQHTTRRDRGGGGHTATARAAARNPGSCEGVGGS